MEGTMDFMIIFNLVIGIYALYAGITGKGAAYKNDYPKKIQAEANALMRKFLLIAGPIMIAGSAIEYFKVFGDFSSMIGLITIGILLVMVVGYIIIFRRRYGKYL